MADTAGDFDDILQTNTQKEKANTPAPVGDFDTELANNVGSIVNKAKTVGYTPLSDTEKAVIDAHYADSAAKSKGLSIDTVHATMDKQAGYNPAVEVAKDALKYPLSALFTLGENGLQFAKKMVGGQPIQDPGLDKPIDQQVQTNADDLYPAIRTGMAKAESVPVGGMAGIVDYFSPHDTPNAPGTKTSIGWGSDALARAAQTAQDETKTYAQQGSEGTGIPGILSDPINAAMAIPGLGETLKGSGLLAKLAEKYPEVVSAIHSIVAPAAENAALTYAMHDKDTDVSAPTVALGGALGGIGGLIGRATQKGAVDIFPGVKKAIRAEEVTSGKGVSKATQKIKDDLIEPLMRETNLPGTRGQFKKVGDKYLDKSNSKYDEVLKQVEPSFEKVKGVYSGREFTKLENRHNVYSPEEYREAISGSMADANIKQKLHLTEKEMNDYVDDYMERLTKGKYTPADVKGLEDNIAKRKMAIDAKEKLGDIKAKRRTVMDEIRSVEKQQVKNSLFAKELQDKGHNVQNSIEEAHRLLDASSKYLYDNKQLEERLENLKAHLAIFDQNTGKQVAEFEKLQYPTYHNYTGKDNLTLRSQEMNFTPKDAQDSRSLLSSDIYNNRMSEKAMQSRNAAKGLKSAINDLFQGNPDVIVNQTPFKAKGPKGPLQGYETLTGKDITPTLKDAAKNYAIYSKIDDLLEEYGRNDGHRVRVGNGPLSLYSSTGADYVLPRTAYGLGSLLPKVSAPLISAVDHTFNKKKKK